jgi:purine-binding chemotaxis protein CheW
VLSRTYSTKGEEIYVNVQSITNIKQYLTFQLDGEVFAIDVCNVREILELTTVTRVPKTPEFMRSVINLRGSVVPVLDMRLKFGITRTEKTVDTCIIVVEVSFEEENTIIGALVDSVQEVFDLELGQIEPAPKIGTQIKTEFIKGIGKRDGHFIILLDMDKVFTSEKLAVATGTGTESNALMAGNG